MLNVGDFYNYYVHSGIQTLGVRMRRSIPLSRERVNTYFNFHIDRICAMRSIMSSAVTTARAPLVVLSSLPPCWLFLLLLFRIMHSMVCNDARCPTPMFPSSRWMALADGRTANDDVVLFDATKKLFWLCLCGPVVEPTFGNALGLRRMVLEAFIGCSVSKGIRLGLLELAVERQ